MKPKVYLAGPDIFYANPTEIGNKMKETCLKYGLEGLFPLDAQADLATEKSGPRKGLKLYKADIGLIDKADAIVANISPFRGISADVGTAYELGYAVAQNKSVAVYTKQNGSHYKDRAIAAGFGEDVFELEDFCMTENLMLLGAANNFVHSTFEEAIRALAQQLGTWRYPSIQELIDEQRR